MAREDFDAFPKTEANYVPLTPISFLTRAADAFSTHPAVIHGARHYSWAQTYERCVRLASALRASGIGRNDVVAVIAPNIPEMVEAHFGIAMAGGVLNTINTRLDPDTIAYILDHGEAKVLLTDAQFSPTVKAALERMEGPKPFIVDIMDSEAAYAPDEGERLGAIDHDAFLAGGDPDFAWQMPADEWDAFALNYTSGTSGRPKGVVYHHRGAYLMALGTVAGWPLPMHPKYLYVVPMFHCNGWGHAWANASQVGTIYCTRTLTPARLFQHFAEDGITHFGGAPVILGALINAPDSDRRPFDQGIEVFTAGAPPPAAVIAAATRMGLNVQQVYGLTETYGHVTQCAWQSTWDTLPFDEQAEIKARQGIRFGMMEGAISADSDTLEPVPRDAATAGEIMLRGNTVMKGYFKNPQATAEAFKGGWFHSGDAAIVHEGGYLQINDRLKDVIISGGENVSSIEVENALYKMPGVLAAAVVAKPDDKWGEVPCAFIEAKPGAGLTEADVIAFARARLAGFKTPKKVVFTDLPKTSTGKIQKFVLRQQAKDMA